MKWCYVGSLTGVWTEFQQNAAVASKMGEGSFYTGTGGRSAEKWDNSGHCGTSVFCGLEGVRLGSFCAGAMELLRGVALGGAVWRVAGTGIEDRIELV
jgi:hypothetical protein